MQTRFEILAEAAMQAIVDGYYRDAISSFSASLERVYEFYVRVVTHHTGMDGAIIEDTWKFVKSQSERQLGMYVGLYLLENKAVPPVLPRKYVELRNRVIRQGYVPTEDDAIEFAQAVVNIVQPLLNGLMRRYRKTIEALTLVHMSQGAALQDSQGVHRPVSFEFVYEFLNQSRKADAEPADINRGIYNRTFDNLVRE